MKNLDKFSIEKNENIINSDRNENEEMKTGTVLRLSNQEVFDICSEVARDFEWMSIQLDDSIFDGIKPFDENCEAAKYFPPTNLFDRYFPGVVDIDGVRFAEYGMYNLPDTVNQLKVSEYTVSEIIKKYNLSLSVETAMKVLSQPVYQLPFKIEVINWVRSKTMAYIDAQPDNEEGQNNIAIAGERFRRFVNTFDKKYDEARFAESVLEYSRLVKEESDRVILDSYYEMKIRKLAATMLLVIKDMTEFDLANCFWKA